MPYCGQSRPALGRCGLLYLSSAADVGSSTAIASDRKVGELSGPGRSWLERPPRCSPTRTPRAEGPSPAPRARRLVQPGASAGAGPKNPGAETRSERSGFGGRHPPSALLGRESGHPRESGRIFFRAHRLPPQSTGTKYPCSPPAEWHVRCRARRAGSRPSPPYALRRA